MLDLGEVLSKKHIGNLVRSINKIRVSSNSRGRCVAYSFKSISVQEFTHPIYTLMTKSMQRNEVRDFEAGLLKDLKVGRIMDIRCQRRSRRGFGFRYELEVTCEREDVHGVTIEEALLSHVQTECRDDALHVVFLGGEEYFYEQRYGVNDGLLNWVDDAEEGLERFTIFWKVD